MGMVYSVLLKFLKLAALSDFFFFILVTTSPGMFAFKEINLSEDKLGNLIFFRFLSESTIPRILDAM